MNPLPPAEAAPVLVRFMSFPLDGSEPVQLDEDQWTNFDQAFSGYYGYGKRFDQTLPGQPPLAYVVAMPPRVKRVPHATDADKRQIILILQMVRLEQWAAAQVIARELLKGEPID